MMRSKRSFAPLYLFAAVLLAFSAAAVAQIGKPATPGAGGAFTLADGVVVDTASQTAYIMKSEGGLSAVSLNGGTVLWTVNAKAKPIQVVGDLLLAQQEPREAGQLDLVSFRLSDGAPGELTARVELPGDVTPRLKDNQASSWRLSAHQEGDEIVLSWFANKAAGSDTPRGYLPAADENRAPSMDGGEESSALKADTPSNFAGTLRLNASGNLRIAEKASAPRTLNAVDRKLPGVAGRQFLSADGRHVLASRRANANNIWQSYRWTIYERETGERVGELNHFASAAPFVVASGNLFFVSQPTARVSDGKVIETPMQLQAIQLADGAAIWNKEVNDPRYDGPVAP